MSDFSVFWRDKDAVNGIIGTYFKAQNMGIIHPSVNALYDQIIGPDPINKRGFIIKGGSYIKLSVPDGATQKHWVFGSENDFSIANAESRLDTGVSFTPGRDYYIYLCYLAPSGAAHLPTASIVVSLNSTFPSGFSALNSRKIGGFHTLCSAVGTIAGHPLSGFAAGDILPASFWDLRHRPTCSPEGMVYVRELDFWADIYLQSGTGINTKSVYLGTITDTQNFSSHIEDLFRVGKVPLSDEDFSCAAEGSNQKTIIAGGADPGTTGAHTDTAGRRMISNYGLEDCCGALFQWVRGLYSSPSPSWTDDSTKGACFGGCAAAAGGSWSHGSLCGSRCRIPTSSRISANDNHGCRGRAPSRALR